MHRRNFTTTFLTHRTSNATEFDFLASPELRVSSKKASFHEKVKNLDLDRSLKLLKVRNLTSLTKFETAQHTENLASTLPFSLVNEPFQAKIAILGKDKNSLVTKIMGNSPPEVPGKSEKTSPVKSGRQSRAAFSARPGIGHNSPNEILSNLKKIELDFKVEKMRGNRFFAKSSHQKVPNFSKNSSKNMQESKASVKKTKSPANAKKIYNHKRTFSTGTGVTNKQNYFDLSSVTKKSSQKIFEKNPRKK